MTEAFRVRRKARRAGVDVFVHHETVTLERRQDLFQPPALDEFGGSANLTSGVEQLVADLVTVWPVGEVHVTIELPRDEIGADTEPRVKASIESYCDRRVADLESHRVSLRNEGFSALALSVPLLMLTLLLTAAVSESGLPSFWRSFLGDGVLLVLAWVALWYPLDTLLWYGRPLTHEIRVLHSLRRATVEVRPTAGPG